MNPSDSASRPAILITGASRGIGRAIAEQLAGRGCRIAVHCRQSRAAAEALAAALPGGGHRAFAADLAGAGRGGAPVGGGHRRAGADPVLVNNAGIFESHPPLGTRRTNGGRPGSAPSPPTCWARPASATWPATPWPPPAAAGW